VHVFDQPKLAVRYPGLRPVSNVVGLYGAAVPDRAWPARTS
jgi:hypothetical protein